MPLGAALKLHLSADHAVIHGRILDSQGRPVAHVGVRVERVAVPVDEDLDGRLASGRLIGTEWPARRFASLTCINRRGSVVKAWSRPTRKAGSC